MLRFSLPGRSQKFHSFTDEQIQTKVYELWKARGFVGSSPEEGRLKAISLLEEESELTSGRKYHLDGWGNKDDREFALKVKQFQWERFKTIISALGLGATAVAAISLFITYRQGEERLVTERFSKAVEQLGSQDIAVRIGSIYALERIAKDSSKDHWTVMEVLTAYVREHSRVPKDSRDKVPKRLTALSNLPEITTDIQSVLSVISRRDLNKENKVKRLNLAETNLNYAKLSHASLSNTNLNNAALFGADLSKSDLSGAELKNTYLNFATLVKANLNKVKLTFATLDNVSGACHLRSK